MCVFRPRLVLQGSHAFLQMELQSFIGLSEQTIHRVRQTLVVLLVHFLSLTSLMSVRREREREKNPDEGNDITKFSLLTQTPFGCIYAANQASLHGLKDEVCI